MIWAIPIAMAAAGALQGKMRHDQEVANENADRKLASETARYSPWTGMTPGPIRRAGSSTFGSVLGGAQQGFASGMGIGGMMGGGGAPTTGMAAGQMGDMSAQNWNTQMNANQGMYGMQSGNAYVPKQSIWGSMS